MTIDTDGRIADPRLRAWVRGRDPHHQTGTSWEYANGRALDPTRVPFIVLPTGYNGAQNGDLAVVEYRGKSVLAVVGDRGPDVQIGEGSIALANALGIDPDGRTGGVRDGVTYTVFPGSGQGRFRSEVDLLAFIDGRGGQLYAALGGGLRVASR